VADETVTAVDVEDDFDFEGAAIVLEQGIQVCRP
jgi:hypothetical protein